jgi:hypothetical protein
MKLSTLLYWVKNRPFYTHIFKSKSMIPFYRFQAFHFLQLFFLDSLDMFNIDESIIRVWVDNLSLLLL